MTEPQIVIGVTGSWDNRTQLVQDVATKSDGYLLAGNIFHNPKNDIGFQIDTYEYDRDLKESYSYAGQGKFDDAFLNEIDNHTHTIYLLSNSAGFEEVRNIIEAALGILKAGGIGVKIETTGVAYTKEEWEQLGMEDEVFPTYSHFVTLLGGENDFYSIGMKTFGLPDLAVSSDMDPHDAADLMNNFNLYSLIDNPEFKDGETFSMSENDPVYRLIKYNDYRYEQDDIFFNHFGIWRLEEM